MLFLESGDYKKALEAYKEAIRINPEYAPAHSNKGNAHYALREYKYALDAFNAAIRIDSEHIDAYYNKGIMLSELNDHEEAVKAYKEVTSRNPRHANAYFKMGNELFELEHYEEAADAYEKVLDIDPGHALARNNMDVVLSTLIRELKQHTSLNSEDARAHFKLGNAFARLEYYKDAADAYDEVLRIDPGHAEARDNRRTALDNLVKECEQFILSNPVSAYFNMGNAFVRLGHDKDAAIAYMQVLNINQWHAGANNNIGVVIDNLQQRSRSGDAGARADLQALGLNPDRGPEESVRGEDAPVIQNPEGSHHSQVSQSLNPGRLLLYLMKRL